MSTGRRTAGRYQILGLVGRGGMGTVFRARDTVLGRDVALKRPHDGARATWERARREAAALTLARFPGVVPILDQGDDEDGPYLVTELIDGDCFPGPSPDLLRLAVQLLEILARVHRVGLVHRDVKPGNVLVDRRGQVWLLDFGLARGRPLGTTMTTHDQILGTLRYLAPEQLTGEPADARTDLYAVGLVLYEALAGRGPFDAPGGEESPFVRVWRDAPPLGDLARDASPVLVRLVDALLARLPDRRPGSAAEALALVEAAAPAPQLRLAGREQALGMLLQAARSGRPLGVTGPPGVGRSRLLREVASILVAEGRGVRWLPASERPYGSLLGGVEGRRAPDPDAAWRCMQDHLDAGGVIVGDPTDRVDPWTVDGLARLRGAVLGPGSGVHLAPLTELELRDLFEGPDRVFHLREDGARHLFRRSRGSAAAVVGIVAGWVANGWATVHEGRIQLDIPSVAALAEGGHSRPGFVSAPLPVDGPVRRMLAICVLAGGDLDRGSLVAVEGGPEWEAALLLDELARQGRVEVDGDGRLHARPGSDAALAGWTEAERAATHVRIAGVLPPGTERRLRHLLWAGPGDHAAREARVVAEERMSVGRIRDAFHLLDATYTATRPHLGAAREKELLAGLLVAATASDDRRLRDLVAVRLAGSALPAEELGALRNLAEAALALATRDFRAAEALVERVPPQAEEPLEILRVTLWVEARHRSDPTRATADLASLESWALQSDERHGRWLGWRGLAAYRRGEFQEAVALHRSAGRLRSGLGAMLASLNEATAALEVGDFSRAEDCGREVVGMAADLREAAYELRGWSVLRNIAYRRDHVLEVDDELVACARLVPSDAAAAPVLFTEGVVAWRAGDVARATDLLRASRARFGGYPVGSALCEALLVAMGTADESERRALRDRDPDSTPPHVNHQVAALCRAGGMTDLPPPSGPSRRPGVACDARMEVLSHDELGGADVRLSDPGRRIQLEEFRRRYRSRRDRGQDR